MKDKVFIAWSGKNNEALEVKKLLGQNGYVCFVGGNYDNNSDSPFVLDTVIEQMKTCNQAIAIFQNKQGSTEGEKVAVSSNMFFELGYVLASYGTKKVHCVRRKSENIELPSDFSNAFVEPIEEKENQDFATGIVNYFMSRQKMAITENKMNLINNRYLIRDKISAHYSQFGSKCSDYELAQYVLFYMQAAHMFGDEEEVCHELANLKRDHQTAFSRELSIAVNMSMAFLNMAQSITVNEENGSDYIKIADFMNIYRTHTACLNEINSIDNGAGVFASWAKVFIYEHLAFACMLYANGTTEKTDRDQWTNECRNYAEKTIEQIESLIKDGITDENSNDGIGILALLKAYVYRNLYLVKKYFDESDANEYLQKSFDERNRMKMTFEKGSIDTQLYNTFNMEYYLALTEYLSLDENKMMKSLYMADMRSALEAIESERDLNVYWGQIKRWYEEQK